MNSKTAAPFARLALILAGSAALAATPLQALAPPDGKGGGNGGGDSTGTDFNVEVADDAGFASGNNLWVPMDGTSPCLGWSAGTSGSKPDYAARWRIDGVHLECQDLTTSTGNQLTDDIVVKVMMNSTGRIDRIQVTGQDLIGAEGLWHRSDVIPVAIQANPSNAGFTIHVHARDVAMWKCNTHLPKRQTTCDVQVGTFSIDDMVYVPATASASIESTIRYAPGEKPD